MKTFDQVLKEVYLKQNCAMYGVIVPCIIDDTHGWNPVAVCGCVQEARKRLLEDAMKG
jgi:hypothetical protein